MSRWHPKTWPYDEEPDPDYDSEADYEAYEEACIEKAEFYKENRYDDDHS